MAVVTRKRLAALCLGLAASFSGTLEAKKPLTEVADLRYGVTLYHYYQQDYFKALTELYLAEVDGGVQGHGDNPDIIAGGIALAFGMERTAGDAFNELLDPTRPAKVRNTAWFYLAKLAYARGHWPEAEAFLSKLETEQLNRVMTQETQALQANILLRQERFDDAEALVAEFPNCHPWKSYLNYNLASAMGRNGQFERALEYYLAIFLDPITVEHTEPELELALRDRAHTAAAYAHMAESNFQLAKYHFEQVRLTDVLANEALLGSGWAALNGDNYAEALAPWQELLRRGMVYPEAQEAHLAIPFAYEQMGAPGEALLAYVNAEQAFVEELGNIQAVQTHLKANAITELLEIRGHRNSSWLQESDPGLEKVSHYLRALVAQNQFQARVQELRELEGLNEHFKNWQLRLGFYHDLGQARIDDRARQRIAVAEAGYGEKITELSQLRDQLSQTLNAIESQQDYLQLARGDNRDLAKRATNALDTAARLTDRVRPEQAQKAKLLHGILYWNESQTFHDQRWQLQSRLAEVNQQLDELNSNHQRVTQLLEQAPDLEPMNLRLDTMQTRLDQGQAELAETLAEVSDNLRQQMLAELDLQRSRLTYFLAESRLAIARIYDQRLAETLAPAEPEPSIEDTDQASEESAEPNTENEPSSDLEDNGGGA